MRAIPQLVSAPLNPIPIAEHFRRSHPPCEHSHGQCTQTTANEDIGRRPRGQFVETCMWFSGKLQR